MSDNNQRQGNDESNTTRPQSGPYDEYIESEASGETETDDYESSDEESEPLTPIAGLEDDEVMGEIEEDVGFDNPLFNNLRSNIAGGSLTYMDNQNEEKMLFLSKMKYDKSNTGYTGLSNQGATCYLNSLIQTLFMTPEVRELLYNWRYEPDQHGSEERSIPLQLQLLFGYLQLSHKRSVGSKPLTRSFGWTSDESFTQHDINELCRVLFDALDKTFAPNLYKKEEEIKKINSEDPDYKAKVKVIRDKYDESINKNKENYMSDLYLGKVLDYVFAKDHFDEEGNEIGRRRNDKFKDVSLPIRGVHSLEEAMKKYVTPEVLDGDNKWKCEALGGKLVDAVKGLRFLRFPNILTVNLTRFDYNPVTWQREKLGHKVSFPYILDIKPFLDPKEQKLVESQKTDTKYSLFSVMIHSGSARFGHYYAYIKSFEDDKWYKFNDDTVTEISTSEVEKMYGSNDDSGRTTSTNAYMLMYRNMSLPVKENIPESIIPEYVRKQVIGKNKEIEDVKNLLKEFKDRCVVRIVARSSSSAVDPSKKLKSSSDVMRFLDPSGEVEQCVLQFISKKDDVKYFELYDRVHQILCEKYESFEEKFKDLKACVRLREYTFTDDVTSGDLYMKKDDPKPKKKIEMVEEEDEEEGEEEEDEVVDDKKSGHPKKKEEFNSSKTYSNQTLNQLKFGQVKTFLLETKEEGMKWPKEIELYHLKITPLFPRGTRYSNQVTTKIDSNSTLFQLKEKVAKMFMDSYRDPSHVAHYCNADHVGILNVVKYKSKKHMYYDQEIQRYDKESKKNDKKLINDLNIFDGADLYVELFEKESRGFTMLHTDLFCYRLFYNHPLQPHHHTNALTIRKSKTLKELKERIAKEIDYDEKNFRILKPKSRKPWENMEQTLRFAPGVFDMGEIHVEEGKPLNEGEYLVNVYYKVMDFEIAKKLEIRERRQQRREFYKKTKFSLQGISSEDYMKKQKNADDSNATSSDDEFDDTLIDRSKEQDRSLADEESGDDEEGGAPAPPPIDDLNLTEHKSLKTHVPGGVGSAFVGSSDEESEEEEEDLKASLSLGGAKVKKEVSDVDTGKRQKVDELVTEEESKDPKYKGMKKEEIIVAKIKALKKKIDHIDKRNREPIGGFFISDSRKKCLGEACKVIVKANETILDLKKKIISQLMLDNVEETKAPEGLPVRVVKTPYHLRLREKKGLEIGRIFRKNSMTCEENGMRFSVRHSLVIELMDWSEKDLEENEDTVILRLRRWNSSEWKLTRFLELKFDKSKNRDAQHTYLKKCIGQLLTNVTKQKIPQDMIYLAIPPPTYCEEYLGIATLPWRREQSVYFDRLHDFSVLLYRFKNEVDLFDLRLCRMIQQRRKNRYFREEKALKIKTEFDTADKKDDEPNEDEEKPLVIKTEEKKDEKKE